jgi:glycerophosphoryl diester phosphodiesterase
MPTHYVHRGLIKRGLEENTLESFKYSIKKGYGIETDVHITKDNQIICFHDFNLIRKFKLNKEVKKLNYNFLSKIGKKKGIKIPLLKDLLKISSNKYPLLLEIWNNFF